MRSQPASLWVSHPLGRALLGLTGVIAFVAVWKLAQLTGWARAGTIPDPFLLPQTLLEEWRSGRMLPAILSSLVHYIWGLGLGTLLGFLVGALAASSRWTDALHAWLARILRPIPPLAWLVFAIAWFKVSRTSC